MTDLVERVARAIRCGQRFTTEAAARAAIAVVLEEAAIKVLSYRTENLGKLDNAAEWPFKWTENLLDQIAAAIRALNPKER